MKRERNLLATLDVFHGNKLLGLLVPHEPSHPKIPSSQILDSLILIHNQIPQLNQSYGYGLQKGGSNLKLETQRGMQDPRRITTPFYTLIKRVI